MKIKPKYKVGQKVQLRHSLNNIVYEIYAIQIYKKGRIWYNIHVDTSHEIADEYQLKRYRKINIWLTTE